MNSQKLICIEGKHLLQKQTGVQRHTNEILSALDKIIGDSDLVFELVIPTNTVCIPEYKNIKIVKYGRSFFNSRIWLQTGFGGYVRSKNATALCLGNEMPLYYKNSIVQLHDVNSISYAQKQRALLKYYFYYYWILHIKKHAGLVLTVSQKSRYDIHAQFSVAPEKLKVIYNSYEHILDICPSGDALHKYNLVEGSYYFSVGSPYQPTKNLEWICRAAKSNPEQTFVISGRKDRKKFERPIDYNIPDNVHLIGYASDSEIVELMTKCKAFLFPSLAEGFGIPPMEALALGSQIVVSNTPPMPEIYGGSAHYIDPLECDCDLQKLINEPVAPPEDCLNRFSWKKSAEQMLTAVENFVKQ